MKSGSLGEYTESSEGRLIFSVAALPNHDLVVPTIFNLNMCSYGSLGHRLVYPSFREISLKSSSFHGALAEQDLATFQWATI